jgi:DNA-directed RNA polymerase subunit RPC12/RpoP
MSVFFECVQCEADFELEIPDLMRDPSLAKCPNCGSKANTKVVESAFLALEEFVEQIGRLRRKFRVGLSIESDELSEDLEDEYDEQEDEAALWSDEPDEEDAEL